MGAIFSLFAVMGIIAAALAGVGAANQRFLFGVVIPYSALAIFILGLIYRVVYWARSPVPFRIPVTCGQQKSLPWIKADNLDNPHNTLGVIGRMALEVLFFRSLFRNTNLEMRDGPKLTYEWEKWLWLAGLAFHWSFLVVFLRHLRFFLAPLPAFVGLLEGADGFFQIGLPALYLTDAILVASLTYLVARRFMIARIRYISLASDYFPLFLILAIAATGILMRHFIRVDVETVKEFAVGLASFNAAPREEIGVIFYVHLLLVSALFAYFPFSKLMHLGGVFLSPTKNLANNNRMKRHVNPWNYPVKVHTYEEYEDEFRDKMRAAGLPLEKE
jgi:nitrate reductase gamma subunit